MATAGTSIAGASGENTHRANNSTHNAHELQGRMSSMSITRAPNDNATSSNPTVKRTADLVVDVGPSKRMRLSNHIPSQSRDGEERQRETTDSANFNTFKRMETAKGILTEVRKQRGWQRAALEAQLTKVNHEEGKIAALEAQLAKIDQDVMQIAANEREVEVLLHGFYNERSERELWEVAVNDITTIGEDREDDEADM
jgi:hypothetical protein